MVEFSEDLSTRYEGKDAQKKRVLYKLGLRKGEIPYTEQGLDVEEFKYATDLAQAIRECIPDFSPKIIVSGDRVLTADISISLSEVS